MNRSTLLKRGYAYLRPYWVIFILAMLASMTFAAVDSYATYLFKPLLDKGFIGKDLHFLAIFPLIILGMFFLRGSASFLGTYLLGRLGALIIFTLRKELFDKFIELPSEYLDQNPSGKLLSKFTFNADQVGFTLGQSLSLLVQQSFFILGLLIVMLYVSVKLTLIVLIIIPMVAFLVRYVSRRFRLLARRIQETMGDLNHIVEESLIGQKEIKIFGAQSQQRSHFMTLLNYNFRQNIKMILTSSANTPIIQLIAACSLALIVFLTFHHMVSLSAGSFITFVAAMLAILKPLRQLTQVNAEVSRALAALEGIFEVLDVPGEVETGNQTLSRVKGEVEFQNVDFAFRDKKWVFQDFSLKLPAKKTIAFVGKSGSGKTTFTQLLTRFYDPNSGRILLDGLDIREMTRAHLRSHFSFVSQHVVLFDDTIFRNIAFGIENPREKAVIEAAKAANAWEFIEKLPEGLNTKLGQNGMSLSGGQRQRIAIARAMLKNSPILILDEATSALDNASERLIQEALETLCQNRTTLIIAHRLSTTRNADWIVVMDQGKVIEQGTPDELLNSKGTYYQLYQHSGSH